VGVRAGLDALKTRKIVTSDGIQTPDRLDRRLDTILTMRSRLYVVKCTRCVILASRMLYPVCYSCLVSAPPSCDRGSVNSHPFPLYATPSSHPLILSLHDTLIDRSGETLLKTYTEKQGQQHMTDIVFDPRL